MGDVFAIYPVPFRCLPRKLTSQSSGLLATVLPAETTTGRGVPQCRHVSKCRTQARLASPNPCATISAMLTALFQLILALATGGVGFALVRLILESHSDHQRWSRDRKLNATLNSLNSTL